MFDTRMLVSHWYIICVVSKRNSKKVSKFTGRHFTNYCIFKIIIKSHITTKSKCLSFFNIFPSIQKKASLTSHKPKYFNIQKFIKLKIK